jgi:uncharacterized protein (DUF1697 family)
MAAWVALLRAVNVGGTGKLAMTDLARLCGACGFANVKTYIASGNVVFVSELEESEVRQRLEDALAEFAGKPIGVVVRSAEAMADVLRANPFPQFPGNRVHAVIVNDVLPADAVDGAKGRSVEDLSLATREIYVHYPDGQGTSKLVIPAAKSGTARNMNTIAKLAEMSAQAAAAVDTAG